MTKISKKLQHKLEVLKNNKIVLNLWKLYKDFYQKEYQTVDQEKQSLEKFITNLKIILKENARFEEGVKSFKLHMNRFGDMSLSEFRKKMTGLNPNRALAKRFVESVHVEPVPMQRRKRFLIDSVQKQIKNIKDKANKKLHPGKTPSKNPAATAASKSMIDYRSYMNPIKNQGQCG